MSIPEIKQKLSIQEVLEHYQIPVKNQMCRCPFHEDQTPSMQVFNDSNTVRCYSGNCPQSNKVIDVIDFIMYYEKLTKAESIKKAQTFIGEPSSRYSNGRVKEYQELPMNKLEEVFYKMKQNLRQSKKANEYTLSRNLTPEQLEIGYNGRTYKGIMNCIVFPLKDHHNKIVSFYGRSIKDKNHYYLKNRQGLYPGYPPKETKNLILTESIIDSASLLQIEKIREKYSVLACYGTNGFTSEHKQAIQELQHLEEIIIIFDNDQAGKQATEKLAKELTNQNPQLQLTTLELPNKDINETLQLHTPEIFTELIEKRKTIERSPEKHSIEDPPKKEPNLTLTQINQLIEQSGIIGEENTRLLLFIIASSYKTPKPLHAIVQGSSGSGKTHLISKIADLMPPEDVLRFTRITESSLYNWGEWDLVGKNIIIEDLDGLKEEALYSLRELISSQKLSSSVSIKDKKGNIKSTQKKVRGIFSSLSATTKGDIYEDNMSRSFILAVDESQEQSQKIIEYQNKKYAGEISSNLEKQAQKQLQDYIRSLQNLEVINPYATQLQLPDNVHKKRRLNQMFQSIIRQITYLNQKNRRISADNQIITEKEDLQIAIEVLFESIILKIDELDGSLRQFYENIQKHFKTQEFTRFHIMESTGLKKTQLQYYLNQLVQLEYLQQFGHPNKGYKYKIAHNDNMQKVRKDLKEYFYNQLEKL
ncbi:toprim domain-containing protein [Apibacter muscae]|uniref:Toprim domain-containing protein n=1 Tax=Apibacter muscae TaxID=2509004 RepID=A0A563DL39_9FLAO|nr:toprim domain-containing protein [Apibacter muscae]TWP30819.1 toprim domain-containing protein [Apibacter muscae]